MASPKSDKPVGRPTEYKPEYCQKLIEFGNTGKSFEAFGSIVGVSKQTLYTWCKEYPEFLDAKRVAKSHGRNALEDMLIRSGRYQGGNPTPYMYLLKSCHNLRDDGITDDEDSIDGLEFDYGS